MRLRLISLTLRNFKGVRDFTLDAQGGNASIWGDNATGKTTLFDAFTWLLHGKDSTNKKDFEIKTLDASGQVIHGIDHEVEAVLDADGRTSTLRKVYSEKFTKKRGSAQAIFAGNTTDHFVNGVPVAEKDYKDYISQIADEDIFRLLTNPLYFNECMHWQAKRSLLLEICGDISDQDVIASDQALSRLPDILGSYSMDDYKKIVAARRTKINDELKNIPVRIDEAERSLADITDIDAETLPGAIASHKLLIENRQQDIARIKSGGEIAERTKQVREIEIALLDILRADREGIEEQIAAKNRELTDSNSRLAGLRSDIASNGRKIDAYSTEILNLEKKMDAGRQEWKRINAEQFTFEQNNTCPTCGQALPEERLQAAREGALAYFNLEKAQKLEANVAKGKAMKGEAEQLKAEMESIKMRDNEHRIAAGQEETRAMQLQQELDQLRRDSLTHTGGPAYEAKLQEKVALEQEIVQLQSGNADAIAKVQQEITSLNGTLDGLLRSQAAVANNQATDRRIQQLKDQERQLAAEFEKLEGELYLCETFIKAKVSLLESKINSKFKLARFKLFDVQVNGGLSECCETTYAGVSYPDLNHGAKLNVGLDIISTLIEHYDFSAPVFVDNAEAVTRLISIPAQMIRLVVMAQHEHKGLVVEIDDVNQKAERKAS